MVHGRMIRPAVAGAVPVKVDEASIKDIPGAKVVWDKGFLGVVADKEWDAIKAAQALKVEWSAVEPPFPEQAALYDHLRKTPPRKAPGRKAKRQRRGGVQDRRARDRGRIRMAVPVARQHGAGMRAGRDQGRQRHLLERNAEGPLPATRHRRHAWCPARQSAGDLDAGARLLWPQRCRRRRHGRRRSRQGGRQAGAGAIHARPGHRLGSERAGLDPQGARRHRCRRQGHGLRVHQQGFSAGGREQQRQQAVGHAGGSDAWAAAQVGRRLRRAGGILRLRQQEAGVGDDPAAARARLAVAHLAFARSGGAANPLRQRILHGRGGGRGSASMPSSSACGI